MMREHARRVAKVERRDGERVEMLTPAQARRYDLMTAAVEAGMRERALAEEQGLPAPTWWNALAPLTARERRGVKNDIARKMAELRGETRTA